MRNFRTFDKAVEFYRHVQTLGLPSHLKEQLLRASSSIALNLAEGGPIALQRNWDLTWPWRTGEPWILEFVSQQERTS